MSSSISYILTEAFNRKAGLSRRPADAKLFYSIISIAMGIGIAMQWLQIRAVKVLLLTTILYGIITPIFIAIILHISNNKKIMGQFINNRISNIIGLTALVLMLATVILLGYFLFVK